MRNMKRTSVDVEYDIQQLKEAVEREMAVEFSNDTYFEFKDQYGNDLTTKSQFAETEEDYQEVLSEIKSIIEGYAKYELEEDEEEEE